MAESARPNPDLFLVIMAGGSGTRFWPKSTAKKPKQLLSFGKDSDATLLERTLDRFDGIVPDDQRLIVTTELLEESIRELVSSNVKVLAEPAGRNTAPCVYWAARQVQEFNPDAVMLVMPADHFMSDVMAFRRTLEGAISHARGGRDLVTLGIHPTRPETGYGYLRTGGCGEGGFLRVEAFVEKPNLSKAIEFLEAGNYLWNGGMFVWKAKTILSEFDRWMPEMSKVWQESGGNVQKAYPKMTATSIDFGIMEKADRVVTFPLSCGWDDLGSWTSLETMGDALNSRHVAGVVSAGECIAVDSTGNIIDAPGRVVSLLGVHDLIIVGQGETILVANKGRAQDIKLIVERIKKERPDLA